MRKKAEGMYDVRSMKAEDFIDDAEIRETLDYADRNKDNVELIDSIIEKAKLRKGLTHREALVLLACEMPDKTAEICDLAEQIKKDFYGNRIVMFAPLYLSNYCVNGCVYCPYHIKNKHIARKKLSQDEVRREVIALQDMGHKRLAIEAGEDPQMNPIEYILECIDTIYSIRHKNGAIRRVNVNIAATTVENYRKLHEAGIGTYILFQETYDKEAYEKLHPYGPKHDYAYHTEAMDRAMEGGIDDVGLGVLFGLDKYRYEFAGLLMHAEHLEAVHGVGPHTISVPRVKKADDIDPDAFDNGISDDIFCKIAACIRIAVPYTGMIISTRENPKVRDEIIRLGVSQISQFFGKYIKDATCGSARILQGEEPVIFTTNHGIDLINANMSLETAENKLLKSNERQDVKLKQFLEGKANQYDFCIIDNPPAVGMCVINALCASDEVIVPVKLDNWAIDGTEMITATIEQLKALNKNLKKITVLITDFIKTPESVAAEEWIRKNCKVPVFKTKIRFSKKVDSATYYKEPLDRYSLMCAAAVDYRKLAKEYLGKE